jgi:hypothetical protein
MIVLIDHIGAMFASVRYAWATRLQPKSFYPHLVVAVGQENGQTRETIRTRGAGPTRQLRRPMHRMESGYLRGATVINRRYLGVSRVAANRMWSAARGGRSAIALGQS